MAADTDSVELWRARYEALVAKSDTQAVIAAEAIVNSAIDISQARGISFGSAFSSLMSAMFHLRAASSKRTQRRKK